MIRVGIGYDVHKLKPGEDFIIGGVKIFSDVGSVGHSDGDALSHAIVDALLGSLGLGDIGKYFPSNDNTWKGAQSSVFLIDVIERITKEGFMINNIDSTIILQKPKIDKYISDIKKSLSNIMKLEESRVNVKATTTDRLGVIGGGGGWACMAIVSLKKIS
ncbi:MAG: 2-C-methyl-D-erythritol 2,4-cyclodiphosphate synthase [Candidatus Neomarinimicrobiota bacterium]